MLIAAAPAAAADRAECAAAYDPVYETEWETAREDWDARCGKISDPRELFRKMQRRFIGLCRKEFQEEIDAGTLTKAKVYARCAQGVRGREKLGRLLEARDRKADSEVPPRERARVDRLADAERIARAYWTKDACASGIVLRYEVEEGPPAAVLDYLFFSPSKWKGSFLVRFRGEEIPRYDPIQKHPRVEDACLPRLGVDLDRALALAEEYDLPPPERRVKREYRLEVFARTARDPVWLAESETRRLKLAFDAAEGAPFPGENGEPLFAADVLPSSLLEFCGEGLCP
jgi:hypothetical protein